MSNIQKNLILIAVLVLLTPGFVSAQTKTSIEGKREATKNAIEEKRAEIRGTIKETQDKVEELRGTIGKRRIENRSDRNAKNVNKKFDNLERLEDLTARTLGQADKLNDRGIDTMEARASLDEVRIILDSLYTDLEDLKAISPALTSLIQTPAQRELNNSIDEKMRNVRELLAQTLDSLRANAENQKNDKSATL